MDLIQVDHEKCNKDGICVATCPLGLLTLAPNLGPVPEPGADAACIGCGHCVAACPKGALDNSKSPLSEHLPIPAGYSPDPETAMVFLRSRRSIRSYKDEPVSREEMLKLLDIARFAPSGHNHQGVSYLVVEGPENILRVREIVIEWMREMVLVAPEIASRFHMPTVIQAHEEGQDRVLRGAPQLIVAHAPRSLPTAQVTTYLALEYVELYAPALGLGTCWAGYTQACAQQHPPLSEFLKIPADRVITGILMAGRPKYAYHRLPTRNPLDVEWFGADSL